MNLVLLHLVCVSWCACGALGSVSLRRAGWIDRAVSFYRGKFLNDVQEIASVRIRASLVHAPPPVDEASVWDYPAVERLLALLGADEGAAPLRSSLRRALRPSAPTRRFISKKESWKMFPSIGKIHGNNIYYDFASDETDSEERPPAEFDASDDVVLVVENPVEARLPSSRISIKLLREILESRALAARAMPSTEKSTIPWIPMKNTTSDAGPTAGGNATEAGETTQQPSASEAGTTAAAGDDKTTTVAPAGNDADINGERNSD